ncbi:hypothetical protein J6590_083169 [Homalodisca vitripennis]|nr:hypothetical protein J6590_083169 [Homalodisca vitripennis]
MDLLPLEALNIIAENRILYMVAASTPVSVAWSGCFKQSWMWWPHCNTDTAEFLETAECRVDPKFESLESKDSTQTCLYKKAGNKKITIKESLNRNGFIPTGSIKYNRRELDTTLYVLAASSTVSVDYSGSFNQNWMWWPHCNADTPEYLETGECRVDPKFESPESEDGTQTCLYKKAGNKKITRKESL